MRATQPAGGWGIRTHDASSAALQATALAGPNLQVNAPDAVSTRPNVAQGMAEPQTLARIPATVRLPTAVTAPPGRGRIFAVASVIVGLIGALAVVVHRQSKAPGTPTDVVAPTAVSSSAPNASPADAEPASSDRVQLTISPPNARAELDGVPAVVREGTLVISGSRGSVHRVRLTSGTRESSTEVTITENGAVPAHVALDSGGGDPRTGSAPSSTRRLAPVSSGTPSTTRSAPAPKGPPTAPQVGRDFE